MPWNAPAILLLRDLAPALAAGVTAIVKPAPQTPLITERLVELAAGAGIPPGVLGVVHGGPELGRALVEHPAVRAVAFTGSTATGRAIMRSAAEDLTRVLLELGGKSPAIVFDDADVDAAAAGCLRSGLSIAGQFCMATTRIIAQRGVYDAVREAVCERAEQVAVGAPDDPASGMGPLISEQQLDRVDGYIDLARADGSVAVGGQRLHADSGGAYLAPTVLAGDRLDERLLREEIFGPVLTVEPFDRIEDGVALANLSPYGLAGSVWTTTSTAPGPPRAACGRGRWRSTAPTPRSPRSRRAAWGSRASGARAGSRASTRSPSSSTSTVRPRRRSTSAHGDDDTATRPDTRAAAADAMFATLRACGRRPGLHLPRQHRGRVPRRVARAPGRGARADDARGGHRLDGRRPRAPHRPARGRLRAHAPRPVQRAGAPVVPPASPTSPVVVVTGLKATSLHGADAGFTTTSDVRALPRQFVKWAHETALHGGDRHRPRPRAARRGERAGRAGVPRDRPGPHGGRRRRAARARAARTSRSRRPARRRPRSRRPPS